MNTEKRLAILNEIFNFIQKIKPYANEAEFISANQGQDIIDVLREEIELVEGAKPTQCCWSFDLSSLSLITEIGGYKVNREQYNYKEALKLFNSLDYESLTEFSEEHRIVYFNAYALSLGELEDNPLDVFKRNGGGDIDHLEEIEANKFKKMKYQVIDLCKQDFDNFIKALISIEFNLNEKNQLDKSLQAYLDNETALLNPQIISNTEQDY